MCAFALLRFLSSVCEDVFARRSKGDMNGAKEEAELE